MRISRDELENEQLKADKILEEIYKVMKTKRLLAESEALKPNLGKLSLRKRGS